MRLSRAIQAILIGGFFSLGCAAHSGGGLSSSAVRLEVKPLSEDGAGSTLALANVNDRRLAFVADEDDARVHAFDLDRGTELAVSPLPGTPAQLVIAPDGTLFVALRDRAAVARYRIRDVNGALEPTGEIPTAAEPIALALSGRSLLVASGWGAELAVFDTEDLSLRSRVALPREPRAVVAARDGRAFVAHAVDQPLTMVSFAGSEPEVRAVKDEAPVSHGGQGFALAAAEGKIFAPHVVANPDEPATYYGGPTMTPYVATVEESLAPPPPQPTKPVSVELDHGGRPIKPVSMAAFNTFGRSRRPGPPMVHCLLPRAATVRHAPEPRLLVACMGDDVLLEYLSDRPNATSLALKKRALPGGVTGLAMDKKTDTIVAWAQHARSLMFMKLVDGPTTAEQDRNATSYVAASGASRLTEEQALGRRIFHAASDHRLSADGRACASCHPDGRDDGRTWRTPDGPRQTIMLAGRLADTAPYGWTRHAATLQDYFGDTIQRLRGTGLPPKETAALEKYLLSLSAPYTRPQARDTKLIARGKSIFESTETGCSSCHSGATTTDGAQHDVGTGSNGPEALETPSLRFVAKTAPYFHDGRYPNLRALLQANDTKMGSTRHLSAPDVEALATYLETL